MNTLNYSQIPFWHLAQNILKYDPLPALLEVENPALRYFIQRDLLEAPVEPVEALWQLPPARRIINQQKSNGCWSYKGGKLNLRSQTNYDQIETFRMLGELVEKYGFNSRHPAMQRAAEFLFSCQTVQGDFRGIYGSQYTPNYSAALMELLIKAGYADDARIKRGFEWLLSIRQDDGGWAIPFRTRKLNYTPEVMSGLTLEPDTTRPFSHMVTGVVLRAFAAHPYYCQVSEAKAAGKLLLSRFFQRDRYVDRQGVNFWTEFSYPFWFTDLLSSLDTLVRLGFSSSEPEIQEGLAWFREQQQANGLWNLKVVRGKDKHLRFWLDLQVCRVVKAFCAAQEANDC
ncbi:MAG TPA: hypothetical protein VH186_37800 [Chloroflexia bacterium]|nr:hypothetical protein [Chloroflexia bacterium]